MSVEVLTTYRVVWEQRTEEESGECATLLKAQKKLDYLKGLPGFVRGRIVETTTTIRTKEVHE